MTKKRSTKASIRKRLMEQERERLEKKAEHFSEVADNIGEIDELMVRTVAAVDALQRLDVTLAEIEETTGVSASRLSSVRRRVNALTADDGGDLEGQDESSEGGPASDSEGVSSGDEHQHDGGHQ